MARNDQTTRPRLSYAVAFAERSVRRTLADRLRPFDLTLAQYTALSLLGMQQGLSNAQLARRAYVTPQAMNEIIRLLEARGLITRAPSPSHARIHPVHLTAEGRRVLDDCDSTVDRVEQQMRDAAGIDDEDDLVHTLMACARALETGD